MDEAFLDRFGEPAIGAPGIADGRKAALQHRLQHLCRLQGQQGDRPVREARECGIDGEDVNVRVDQARHQGASFEIDRLGGAALDRRVRDFADPVALDQHMVILAAFFAGPVEDCAIGKNDRGHRLSPPAIGSPSGHRLFLRKRTLLRE
jgi:hypothetical protein